MSSIHVQKLPLFSYTQANGNFPEKDDRVEYTHCLAKGERFIECLEYNLTWRLEAPIDAFCYTILLCIRIAQAFFYSGWFLWEQKPSLALRIGVLHIFHAAREVQKIAGALISIVHIGWGFYLIHEAEENQESYIAYENAVRVTPLNTPEHLHRSTSDPQNEIDYVLETTHLSPPSPDAQ